MFLIGTDEAGYGPNLGPLVITMTAWEVPDSDSNRDLYPLLEGAITSAPSDKLLPRVPIADSKQLYKPGSGLATLEQGLLSTLRLVHRPIRTWREIWSALAPKAEGALACTPWYAAYDAPIPVDAEPEQIPPLEKLLVTHMAAAGVHLRALRSAALFPGHWNERLNGGENKAAILATETLKLVQHGVASFPKGPIFIQCDKFGGRNRYAPMLQTLFPEYLIEIHRESRTLSIYRWGPPSARVECRFAAKGETFLPAALASMASKYLRELAMRAFNHFWQQNVPNLKATAGYPLDARRFKAQIATKQKELEIDDRILWRNK